MSSNQKKRVGNRLMVIIGAVLLIMAGSMEARTAKPQKPRFYIKFNGMGSVTTGGDYGLMVKANELFFPDLDASSTTTSIQTKTDRFFRGYGGEIGFETPRFAVGVSAGYLEKNFAVTAHETWDLGAVSDYTRNFQFSALPLFVMIHYKVIDTSFLSAFVTVGEGVYLAKYRDEFAQTLQNQTLTFANKVVEGKRNSLGFQIGTTVDLKFTRNLAIFLEATYRLVQFKELKATDYYEDDERVITKEGNLYYWLNSITGETRFAVGAPTVSQLPWEGLPAVLNLNGFSFSAGIKIIFGRGKTAEPIRIPPAE